LEHYAKCRIHEFHSNNIFSYTRFVPNSISNKITLPDYLKTHARTTKIYLLDFLEILKVSKMREREFDICFYTGSLNHRATSSLSGQPETGFHYYQKFYKTHTNIILLNNRNTKIFYSQKSQSHYCKKHTYGLGITPGTQPKAQELPNLMVGLPSQPNSSSSSSN